MGTGTFDDSAKEEIRARLPIATLVERYVKLKPSGSNLKGLCPFHKEKTPSFMVHSERGIFHCFGCGKGGDIFTFLQEIEGIDFREALKLLAEETGVSLNRDAPAAESGADQPAGYPSKTRMMEIHAVVMQYFYRQIGSYPHAVEYFKSRGLTGETVREFKLGYAPDGWSNLVDFASTKGIPADQLVACGLALQKTEGARSYDRFRNRIIFTLFDTTGRAIAFAARALEPDATPKYLNSPETPIYRKSRTLYGLHKARPAIKEFNTIILVEGYMDFLSLYQAGIRNAVATSGTALTQEHGQIIRRYAPNVVLIFDGDPPGIEAARRGVETLAPFNLNVRVLILPHEEDPDSFVRTRGGGAFRALVENAQDGFTFLLERAYQQHDGTTPRGQAAVAEQLRSYCEQIEDSIIAARHIKSIAERLKISERLLYGKYNLRAAPRTSRTARAAMSASYEETLEANFLRLLVNAPRLVPRARQFVSPQTLTDPFSSYLYSSVLESYDRDPSLSTLIDNLQTPEAKAFISSALVSSAPDERAEEDITHTIGRLQAKFLKTQEREITRRLKMEPQNSRNLLEKLSDISRQLQELEN